MPSQTRSHLAPPLSIAGQTESGQVSARDKIVPRDRLAQLVQRAKAAGETVVHCHGVFDLLHMGHVRHLEQARREGTKLAVTVTADAYVNKGPDRPVFPELLRAEMLAAIEYVDWVAINDSPSAEELIRALKPDVYVKGADYVDTGDDVTGKIAVERQAIEEIGGRLHFTGDITFSSSALLNRHFGVYERPLQEYLRSVQNTSLLPQLVAGLDKISDFRVLLVGDTIIDEYHYVTPMGKTPKENMIATMFQHSELFAGGVVAAARHLADFVREVEIVTRLGEHDRYEAEIAENLPPNVKLNIVTQKGAPTTRKTRFIDPGYMRKLFEIYYMDDRPPSASEQASIDSMVRTKASSADLTISCDFGHGLIGSSTIHALCSASRFLAVNAQSNSGNMGYNLITRYPRADYICIDAPEARLASGERYAGIEEIVSETLPSRIDCDQFIVTHGRHGCLTYTRGGSMRAIPAFTSTIVDTIGAGDAFLAVTSPLVAAGVPLDQVGFLGNAVGALKVGIVGHRSSVQRVPLIKYLTALLK